MKKLRSKFITFIASLCLIVPCMFMLTACSLGLDPDHTHSLTKVDATTATCITPGNTLYYKCDCGKYFSDEEATIEINKDSWIIASTGHSYASTWTYNDTHHWKEAICSHTTEKGSYAEHNLVNNECECGYVIEEEPEDPQATIYTVTESEWKQALAGDNFNNVTMKFDILEDYFDDIDSSVTIIQKITENAVEMLGQEGGVTVGRAYTVRVDETWYNVASNDGETWYGYELSDEDVELNSFDMVGQFFINEKSKFTYDETNHCYVAENFAPAGAQLSVDFVKIYFENGKLVKVEIQETDDECISRETYAFYNYGTTTVDVPEWTVFSEEE